MEAAENRDDDDKVRAMDRTQETWSAGSRLMPVPTVDRTPEACPCGQDLDLCAADHCPRCGVHISFAHAA